MTIRDLTHVVVRAEDLREGDIIVRHRAGRVVKVQRTELIESFVVINVQGELGWTCFEAADPVDVYREGESDDA